MVFAWILIKLIAPQVHLRRTKDGTEFDYDTNTIYYDAKPDPFDKCFIRHVKEKHNFPIADNYSFRLWSILHELGHYFNDDVEEDEWAKALCAVLSKEQALNDVEIQDYYYDSPDEFEATEWAIIWIEEHPRLAKLFSKLLDL